MPADSETPAKVRGTTAPIPQCRNQPAVDNPLNDGLLKRVSAVQFCPGAQPHTCPELRRYGFRHPVGTRNAVEVPRSSVEFRGLRAHQECPSASATGRFALQESGCRRDNSDGGRTTVAQVTGPRVSVGGHSDLSSGPEREPSGARRATRGGREWAVAPASRADEPTSAAHCGQEMPPRPRR